MPERMDMSRFRKRLKLWFRELIESETVYTIAVIILGLLPIVLLGAMFVLH